MQSAFTSQQKRRVAFVHYPHSPNEARLETMPFAFNSVVALAESGWIVDLYLWEEDIDIYKEILPKSVKIVTIKSLRSKEIQELEKPSRFNRVRSILIDLEARNQNRYRYALGLGQIGVHFAAILSKLSDCPLVYYNDEFPSCWPTSIWTRLEREAVCKSDLIVVPDAQRYKPLCRELEINDSKPYVVLPNVTNARPPFLDINWHDRLGLPAGCVPFLNAGSISDWAQIPELLCTVPNWPDEAVVILHSRSIYDEKYRRQLSHLDIPGKIFWSTNPLPENLLNSLVSYCAGNLALYRNLGPNIEYIGYSSGKLMRSIACGSPVIASKYNSLSFVDENRLGVLVNHPLEIPLAFNKIIKDNIGYRNKCLKFSSEQLSFENAWKSVYEFLSSR